MTRDFTLPMLAAAETAFDAAMGNASWQSAIQNLVSAHDAAGGVIFDFDQTTGELSNWHSVDLNNTDKYFDEMNAINPRMHYSLGQKAPHVLTDRHVIDPKAMARHDFYQWMEKDCGLQHFIGARISDIGTISTFLSVEFDARSAPPETSAVQRFSAIVRHFANARRLEEQNASRLKTSDLDGFLANQTSTGLIFLDEKFQFLFANRIGEKLLTKGDCVFLEDDFVALHDRRSQNQFNAQMNRLLAAENTSVFVPPPAIAVQGSRNRLPLVLRLITLPRPIRGPGGNRAYHCLFVQTASDGADNLRATMIAAYDLSEREADLILSLREKHTITQAANAANMARNTARVHLQHIFRKMRINSQNELIQIVEQIATWHSGSEN